MKLAPEEPKQNEQEMTCFPSDSSEEFQTTRKGDVAARLQTLEMDRFGTMCIVSTSIDLALGFLSFKCQQFMVEDLRQLLVFISDKFFNCLTSCYQQLQTINNEYGPVCVLASIKSLLLIVYKKHLSELLDSFLVNVRLFHLIESLLTRWKNSILSACRYDIPFLVPPLLDFDWSIREQ